MAFTAGWPLGVQGALGTRGPLSGPAVGPTGVVWEVLQGRHSGLLLAARASSPPHASPVPCMPTIPKSGPSPGSPHTPGPHALAGCPRGTSDFTWLNYRSEVCLLPSSPSREWHRPPHGCSGRIALRPSARPANSASKIKPRPAPWTPCPQAAPELAQRHLRLDRCTSRWPGSPASSPGVPCPPRSKRHAVRSCEMSPCLEANKSTGWFSGS